MLPLEHHYEARIDTSRDMANFTARVAFNALPLELCHSLLRHKNEPNPGPGLSTSVYHRRCNYPSRNEPRSVIVNFKARRDYS